jgi:MFS family permease
MTSLESYWVGIAFLLSAVVCQPIHTALSDIVGRKPILLICLSFFFVGSLIVATSQNAAALLSGRTIQGIGGGGMEALSEVILTDMTTLKERPKYIGILGVMWASGCICGPAAGALFSELLTWRWIGWVMLPLSGTAMALTHFLTLHIDHGSIWSKLRRVDWIGIGTLMAGMLSLILALAWGGQLYAWSSWQTLFPLTLGVFILLGLAVYEHYPMEPMINPRWFSSLTASAAYFGSFIHGIILWCIIYYATLYFEGARQHSPLKSVVDTFPISFTLTPMAIVCALLIEISRRYLWTVWIGWILLCTGLGSFYVLDYDTSSAVYYGLQVPAGIGGGFLLTALAIPLQAAVPADEAGVAMGTLVFFRAVGSTVGITLGWAIFSNIFNHQLRHIELPAHVPLQDASQATAFISQMDSFQLSSAERAQILNLYAAPIKWIWIACTVLSGLGLVASLFMKDLTLENNDKSRQHFEIVSDIEEFAKET